MEYEKFIDAAYSLPFITDRNTAEAAVKAVLGILASKLEEEQAHKLTENLPEPLAYERLHSHQARKLPISADEYVAVICQQFHLDDIQGSQLIQETLRVTKQPAQNQIRELISCLPPDWSALIESA